jgi:deazaflavin-dependent oxidoreductase (nitroreductase family)
MTAAMSGPSCPREPGSRIFDSSRPGQDDAGVSDAPPDVRETNKRVIQEFRANGGVLGPPFSGGSLLLLTTIGARSGRPYTTPMMFVRQDDGRLMVIASNIGAPSHPDWYRNLVANPRVTVEVGTETFEATATTATGDERAPLWAALVESHPFFADHQAKTSREIPLVLLERLPADQTASG